MSQHSSTIPSVMYTQHPDNASIPYWHTHASIRTHEEIKECARILQDFGGGEYMWDWEGKLVDESVIERLYGKYRAFFSQSQIGRDVYLTFRIPNPRVESGFRLGKAFLTILSAEAVATQAKMHTPPLFEVILPLTESSADLMGIQTKFVQLAAIMHDSFDLKPTSLKKLHVIPLFEKVDTIMRSCDIVEQYVNEYTRAFGVKPAYIRPFCARSDPALNSGMIAPTLAIKCALSDYAAFSRKTGIPLYPIIGPGSLPFRGGLSPETVYEFMSEFAGIRTVLIQSAFRYDYPQLQVKKAIEWLTKTIPTLHAQKVSASDKKHIQTMIPLFEQSYQTVVNCIAPLIQRVAPSIPTRRERVQHIGLFGYSRQMGKTQLPRAIGFTGSCYSLGLPPELYGVGKALSSLTTPQQKMLHIYFPSLPALLARAGRYVCRESIKRFELTHLDQDLSGIEAYIGTRLGPRTASERAHAEIVKHICDSLERGREENIAALVEQAAVIRKSIG